MTVESASTIAQLDATLPRGSDPRSEGDNHMRLIKAMLKTQFTSGGPGLDAPVTVTAQELNSLAGVTGNIEERLVYLEEAVDSGILPAPEGTKMLFANPGVPLGWTLDLNFNDRMIRVVATVYNPLTDEGGGGKIGGHHDPVNVTHYHETVDHELTEGELPSHNHGGAGDTYVMATGSEFDLNTGPNLNSTLKVLEAVGQDKGHNHGKTEGSQLQPRYVDIIVGIKD